MANANQTSKPNQDAPASKNPPVARINDGTVTAKVWRNTSREGEVYYNTTISRVYTDPKTDQPAETQSFSQSDLLKIEKLAAEAYRTIQWNREQDKGMAREAEKATGPSMSEQRDAAMQSASSQQQAPGHQQPQHAQTYAQPGPERS